MNRNWMKMDWLWMADEGTAPYRFHVGMRMVKTVVAVFLCGLTGWLRGETPIFAMFAAVLCIQNTKGETLVTAFNRVLGTIVGGAFGVALVYFCYDTWLARHVPLYYLAISLLLIPIISVTLMMKKPSMAALTCVVFLSITVAQSEEGIPLAHAFQRVLDTLIGIVVTVAVDVLLPNHGGAAPAEADVPASGEDRALPGTPVLETLPETDAQWNAIAAPPEVAARESARETERTDTAQ